MKRCSTAQLREKEIINRCDRMRPCCAEDFEFDLNEGRITALLLVEHRSIWNWGKCEEFRIAWDRIECIGEDTILVKIPCGESIYCDFIKRNARKSPNA